MSFSVALFAVASLVSAQAQPDTEALLRTTPLLIAYGWCTSDAGSEWAPVDPEDPYVQGVREYWEAGGKRTGTQYEQVFLRGLNRDGKPNGIYLQHIVVGNPQVGQHSCIVHFPDRAPPNVGPEELEHFAESKPTQGMIPLLWNQTSWEARLPNKDGYDYLRITNFAPGVKPTATYADHPFRGTQYRFLKTGAF